MRPTTKIDELANEFVKTLAKNYPSFATSIGFPGSETEMDDHSPQAVERDYALQKAPSRNCTRCLSRTTSMP